MNNNYDKNYKNKLIGKMFFVSDLKLCFWFGKKYDSLKLIQKKVSDYI